MEKFKLGIFSIVILALTGLVLYWAVNTIQTGSDYKASERLAQLEKENEDLKKERDNLKSELSMLKQDMEEVLQSEETVIIPENPTSVAIYKNQTLINELEKLISDNIFLKLQSQGTRVGTVQKFLNLYNKTSNRVDNDYGAST